MSKSAFEAITIWNMAWVALNKEKHENKPEYLSIAQPEMYYRLNPTLRNTHIDDLNPAIYNTS